MSDSEELIRLNELVENLMARTDRLEKYVMYDEDDNDDDDDVQVEVINLNGNARAGSFLEGLLSRMGGQSEEHECYHAQMLREQGERFKSILEERDAEIERLQLVIETLEGHIAGSDINEEN